MRAFQGPWRLVSGRAHDATGRASLVVSDGLQHYTSSGLVAAQCVISPESEDPELHATLGGYVAYFGTFTVDEAARTQVTEPPRAQSAKATSPRAVLRWIRSCQSCAASSLRFRWFDVTR